MQSGTIMSVKTVEGTSVKSKIWGSFSFYFLHIFCILSLACNSLLSYVFVIVRPICSFFLYCYL